MDGKVIVVTGALGALGRVVAEQALARGAHIAASKDFCAYLTSSNAVEAIRRNGMEPA